MTRILPVAGTWAYDGDPTPDEWYHPHSPLFRFLNGYGIEHVAPDEPFVWDGEVDGVSWPTTRSKHLVWKAAASALAFRLKALPFVDRNVIAHSHGGQVAIYAASVVPIYRLITVSTPVRKDMLAEARKVRTGGWKHLYSDWSDKMQVWGGLFDGAFGIERRFMIPRVENVQIKGVGHSTILNDPARFHYWLETGVIDFLMETPEAA